MCGHFTLSVLPDTVLMCFLLKWLGMTKKKVILKRIPKGWIPFSLRSAEQNILSSVWNPSSRGKWEVADPQLQPGLTWPCRSTGHGGRRAELLSKLRKPTGNDPLLTDTQTLFLCFVLFGLGETRGGRCKLPGLKFHQAEDTPLPSLVPEARQSDFSCQHPHHPLPCSHPQPAGCPAVGAAGADQSHSLPQKGGHNLLQQRAETVSLISALFHMLGLDFHALTIER